MCLNKTTTVPACCGTSFIDDTNISPYWYYDYESEAFILSFRVAPMVYCEQLLSPVYRLFPLSRKIVLGIRKTQHRQFLFEASPSRERSHILPGEKKTHLQKCFGKGYVSSQEGDPPEVSTSYLGGDSWLTGHRLVVPLVFRVVHGVQSSGLRIFNIH